MIAQLFGMPLEHFLADHWPDRVLQVDGPIERLADLIDPAPVLARLRDGTAGDHDLVGELAAIRASAETLGAELGIAHGDCRAIETSLSKRFDDRDAIVVQLVGTARWQVSAAPAVGDPLRPHVAGLPVHALNRHAGGALDELAMPADATSHALQPGSALVVPRGHWHSARVTEASLALSFGLRPRAWAELFVDAALDELARDPRWRARYDARDAFPRGVDVLLRAMRAAIDLVRGTPPPRDSVEE